MVVRDVNLTYGDQPQTGRGIIDHLKNGAGTYLNVVDS